MTITYAEWKDYFSVQQSGVMNMWQHPLIIKFAPDNNYAAAHEHFEVQGNTEDLVIEEDK